MSIAFNFYLYKNYYPKLQTNKTVLFNKTYLGKVLEIKDGSVSIQLTNGNQQTKNFTFDNNTQIYQQLTCPSPVKTDVNKIQKDSEIMIITSNDQNDFKASEIDLQPK